MALLMVQTLNDEDDGTSNPGDPDLSLREALRLANGETTTPGADVIQFDDDLSGDVNLQAALGQLVITSNVTLDGDGRITLDGQDTTRVLSIARPIEPGAANPEVMLQGLTITGGHTSEFYLAGRGAGIYAFLADLTIVASTVSDNHATGRGASGGGIYLNGSSL